MKIGNLEVYGVIYKVENLINGKVYIGQTIQGYERRYCIKGNGVERIYKRHKMFKKYGYDYNKHLLDSMEKYGVKNFTVNETLDYAFSEYELNIKEKCWIQYYNSIQDGYNETDAINKCGGNTYQSKTTEEMSTIKEKLRASKIGGKNPNARKVKMIDLVNTVEMIFNSQ